MVRQRRIITRVGQGDLDGYLVFSVSGDGRIFRQVATVRHDVPLKEQGPLVRTLRAVELDVRARYVRAAATNIGRMPDWHPVRNVKAWLFIDEFVVNPQE